MAFYYKKQREVTMKNKLSFYIVSMIIFILLIVLDYFLFKYNVVFGWLLLLSFPYFLFVVFKKETKSNFKNKNSYNNSCNNFRSYGDHYDNFDCSDGGCGGDGGGD